jgi:hypothetical protein
MSPRDSDLRMTALTRAPLCYLAYTQTEFFTTPHKSLPGGLCQVTSVAMNFMQRLPYVSQNNVYHRDYSYGLVSVTIYEGSDVSCG